MERMIHRTLVMSVQVDVFRTQVPEDVVSFVPTEKCQPMERAVVHHVVRAHRNRVVLPVNFVRQEHFLLVMVTALHALKGPSQHTLGLLAVMLVYAVQLHWMARNARRVCLEHFRQMERRVRIVRQTRSALTVLVSAPYVVLAWNWTPQCQHLSAHHVLSENIRMTTQYVNRAHRELQLPWDPPAVTIARVDMNPMECPLVKSALRVNFLLQDQFVLLVIQTK